MDARETSHIFRGKESKEYFVAVFALESGSFFELLDFSLEDFLLFFFDYRKQLVLAFRPGFDLFGHLLRVVKELVAPVGNFT